MDNQLQQHKDKTSVQAYKPNLKAALQVGNKANIQTIIRDFKAHDGSVDFPAVFAIPTDQRLAKMAEDDFRGTLTIVAAGVTLAMESLNLKIPMNPIQILDLSEAILDTAGEDNLSLEDLMLFLQQLTRGKYHPLYESMDVPKFMEKFEIYREDRHRAMVSFRENKHLEFKALGDPTRSTKPATVFEEHLASFTNKLGAMKDELKEVKSRNK